MKRIRFNWMQSRIWPLLICVIGILTSIGIYENRKIIDRLDRDAEVAEANLCVRQWERWHQIRDIVSDAAEAGAYISLEAIIDYVSEVDPNPGDPAEQRIEEVVEGSFVPDNVQERMGPVLDSYPAPECNLDQAKTSLEK